MPKQNKSSKLKDRRTKNINKKRSTTGKVANKIKGFYILIRPRYTLFVILVVFAGLFIASGKVSVSYIVPIFVIALHYMAICVKDDIEDYEVDLKLDKGRPLVKGMVSIQEAYSVWIGLHLLALPLSLLVSNIFCITMALFILIGVVYAQQPFRFSDRGVFGNLFFVWFSVQLPFLGGALAVNGLNVRVIVISFLSWIWVFIVDLLKDFLLSEHNRLETRVSFVMQMGASKASKLYSVLSLLYILGFPLAYWALNLNLFFFSLASIVAIWLAYVSVKLLRNPLEHKTLLIRSYFLLPPLIVISFIIGSI